MTSRPRIDFSDTETAFSHKSNLELRQAALLFRMMNIGWLVDMLSSISILFVKWKIPGIRWLLKNTIFKQFVGGETLPETKPQIDELWQYNILTILDYGAEGRSSEPDLDRAHKKFVEAVSFAATNRSVPVVSLKLSALAANELLETVNRREPLVDDDMLKWKRVDERLDDLCRQASRLGVSVFIDAEESWMQDAIDELAHKMMHRYNRSRVTVYNTFQMYRHDRLAFLMSSHHHASSSGYMLGAKLVRGAYLDKERARANELGIPSPIHSDKEATDRDFDLALSFCVENYQRIAFCAATHNDKSCQWLASLIDRARLVRNHPHLNFCQLYGMSDHITYNLAANGYTASKYVVFGRVEEVTPYLVRRAEENRAISGEFNREYKMLLRERRRRKSLVSLRR